MNQEFPRKNVSIPSVKESLIEGASYRGEIVDPETRVTTVDIARAGMLPSQVCFDELCGLMRPEAIRQDHLMMSRLTAEDQRVTGAGIGGMKLAGPVDGRVLLFPDPLGATGSSLATAIQFYKDKAKEHPPAKIITLNLIVTPQFIQRLTSEHPEVAIYAFRLDRGMSPETILQSGLGEYAAEESGLTETQYIVPGGGGFGELLNNALE